MPNYHARQIGCLGVKQNFILPILKKYSEYQLKFTAANHVPCIPNKSKNCITLKYLLICLEMKCINICIRNF